MEMAQASGWTLAVVLTLLTCIPNLIKICQAMDMLRLDGGNFELAISHYSYVAAAFIDGSDRSSAISQEWDRATQLISELWREDELYEEPPVLALIDANDPDIQEIVEVYDIEVPGIKVFRHGMLYDYDGPIEATYAAPFLIEDAKPSFSLLDSIDDLAEWYSMAEAEILIVGVFEAEALLLDEGGGGGGGGPWEHFVAAADALRGLAAFAALAPEDEGEEGRHILDELRVHLGDLTLPFFFQVAANAEGGLRGELQRRGGAVFGGDAGAPDLGAALADWALVVAGGGAAGAAGALELRAADGGPAAARFFASPLVKGIAFVPAAGGEEAVAALEAAGRALAGRAQLGYVVGQGFPEVAAYFGERPGGGALIAHDPAQDTRFPSTYEEPLEYDNIMSFMSDVLEGRLKPSFKSEPVPKKNDGPVKKLVGSTLVEEVSKEGVDVLVKVYAPWCAHSAALAPAYELLGRALGGEPRVVVAEIDGAANDLPPHLDVQAYPDLLWFPAADKPYPGKGAPQPRALGREPGRSLQELLAFVRREASPGGPPLRAATPEQLDTLAQEAPALEEQALRRARWALRNKDRVVFEPALVDYLVGDVVFDGCRWMIGLVVALVLSNVFLFALYSAASSSAQKYKKKLKAQ